MECNVCKKPLKDKASWCESCKHFQDWNSHCPRCQSPIHEKATFCVHCKSDFSPKKKGTFTQVLGKLTFPIATITSAIVLITSIAGLEKTIGKAIHTPSPVLTVLPQNATTDSLKFIFYNSGDQLAFIESSSLKVTVYKKGAQKQVDRELGPYELQIADPIKAFVNLGPNKIDLSAVDSKWEDTVLNAMEDSNRHAYFQNELHCELAMVIKNAKKSEQVEPAVVSLKNEQCSLFLLYRYSS